MDQPTDQPPPGLLQQLATDIRADLARHDITITDQDADHFAFMVVESVGMDAIIAGSSLGTPEAKAMRASIPPEVKDELRKMAREQWRGTSLAERIIDINKDDDMNGGPTHPDTTTEEDAPPPDHRYNLVAVAANDRVINRNNYDLDEVVALVRYYLQLGDNVTVTRVDEGGDTTPGV